MKTTVSDRAASAPRLAVDNIGLAALGFVGALGLCVLAAAHLASLVSGRGPLRAGLAEAIGAVVRLPNTPGDPAAAWGPQHASALPGPVLYYLCLLVTAGAATWLADGARRLWRQTSEKRHPLGVEPHAGLAGPDNLSDLAIDRPQPGRLTLGRVAGQLVAAEEQASLAVVGPTGCGKTAGFAVPALLEWNGPVLATSVKTDLIGATFEPRDALGDVFVYDPTGCSQAPSSTWTPLEACATWAGAMRVTTWLCDAARARRDSVTDGDYWYTQARKALAPLLYAGAIGGHTIGDVVRWVDEGEEDAVRDILLSHLGVRARVDIALASEDAAHERRRVEPGIRAEVTESVRRVLAAQPGRRSHLAHGPTTAWPIEMQDDLERRVHMEVERVLRIRFEARAVAEAGGRGELAPLRAIESVWSKEERLKGSVYATIQNVLLGYAAPEVAATSETCQIDFDAWLSGANTLFVVAPSHEQERLQPVFTVLVQQAIQAAYEAANAAGGTLARPCLVLLDEAGNVAPLRQLPQYAATARSHGITFVSIWQDLAQMRDIYGNRAQTVLNNHRAKIFGTGIADYDTLSYVSRLVGDEEHTERGYSSDLAAGGRRTLSERTAYRPTLPVDVIRRITPNEALLLYGSHLPAHLHLRPWYADEALRALAAFGPGHSGERE